MTTRFAGIQPGIEEALIDTIRSLPPRRAVQVLDFARWLERQSEADEWLEEDITAEELQAEEAAWGRFYLENREAFRGMAREALEEYKAGKTQEMIIDEDGKLSSQ